MGIKEEIIARSGGACELCGSTDDTALFDVEPSDGTSDRSALLCGTCRTGMADVTTVSSNHWRVLADAMWSGVPAVQVLSYRVLKSIAHEGWPQDLLDSLYLEPELQAYADALQNSTPEAAQPTRDSNGTILNAGDSVTLIKDLNVKGANFTAKQGTVVKNIRLTDDPKYIEGKINGTTIVLVADYMKKIN